MLKKLTYVLYRKVVKLLIKLIDMLEFIFLHLLQTNEFIKSKMNSKSYVSSTCYRYPKEEKKYFVHNELITYGHES